MTRSRISVTTGLVLFGLALFVTGCTGSHTYTLSGTFLTTGYSIKIVGSYDEARLQSLQEGINTTLDDIEALIAPNYPGGSELALLNDTESGEFILLSAPMAQVMRNALAMTLLTNGAFTVSRSSKNALAGEVAMTRNGKRDSVVAAASGKDVYHGMQLIGTALIKYRPVQVDLAAISEGYAVDRIADYLVTENVTDYLVELGGLIRTHGRKEDNQPWRIMTAIPGQCGDRPLPVVELNDRDASAVFIDHQNTANDDRSQGWEAVSTADSRIYAAAVIADYGLQAEALAAAFGALAPEKGLELAERENIAASLVVQTHNELSTRYSSAFASYLRK